MKVRRLEEGEVSRKGEFIFLIENGRIATDREVLGEEKELLIYLMEWSSIRVGILNDQRWSDYVNNENPPEEASEWSLDWWRDVFDDYDRFNNYD